MRWVDLVESVEAMPSRSLLPRMQEYSTFQEACIQVVSEQHQSGVPKWCASIIIV